MEARVAYSCLFLAAIIALALLLVPAASTHNIRSNLDVPFIFIEGAASKGAVCLDGSLPGYNFDQGFGSGANSWLVVFRGGGWCDDVESCVQRKFTPYGSSTILGPYFNFSGILNNNAQENPDFFNWNKVVIRYCDGASFAGDGEYKEAGLYFRGQRIFTAAIEDLMSKGMRHANQTLLSGGSEGGVVVLLNCDRFSTYFPTTTRVKCLSDAGLFMDTVDISGGHDMRRRVHGVVTLQGVAKILPRRCTIKHDPTYIQTGIAPNISDPKGKWNNGCKMNFANCTTSQILIFQEFQNKMVKVVQDFNAKSQNEIFINSCYTHGQSEFQDTWLSKKPPMIDNTGISRAVRDWYFDRSKVKKIGRPYPYDKTCHNQVLTFSPY